MTKVQKRIAELFHQADGSNSDYLILLNIVDRAEKLITSLGDRNALWQPPLLDLRKWLKKLEKS